MVRSERTSNEWFTEAHVLGLGIELEMAAIERAIDTYDGTGYLSINLSPATLTSPAAQPPSVTPAATRCHGGSAT